MRSGWDSDVGIRVEGLTLRRQHFIAVANLERDIIRQDFKLFSRSSAGRSNMNNRRILALAAVGVVIGWCAICIAQNNSQTDPPKIVRKAGGVLQGSAIARVEPVYPPLAKAARVSGAVVVEVTIDGKGDVIAAQAISGHPLLKDAAVAAARDWKFAPTQLSGVSVKVIGTLTFNFSLPQETRSSNPTDNDIERAKQAVKANSYSPEAHFKLAEAYVGEGMAEEAIARLYGSIELKPA